MEQRSPLQLSPREAEEEEEVSSRNFIPTVWLQGFESEEEEEEAGFPSLPLSGVGLGMRIT